MGNDSLMASEFQANVVAFGDQPGLGLWSDGHYRQHLRYNGVLAARAPPVVIQTFPILYFVGLAKPEIVFWLDSHEKWHELIRPYANVSSIDLSGFDITTPNAWYEWQDLHNAEHLLLDQAFGTG
jgi:hypothetical protein